MVLFGSLRLFEKLWAGMYNTVRLIHYVSIKKKLLLLFRFQINIEQMMLVCLPSLFSLTQAGSSNTEGKTLWNIHPLSSNYVYIE